MHTVSSRQNSIQIMERLKKQIMALRFPDVFGHPNETIPTFASAFVYLQETEGFNEKVSLEKHVF